MLRIAFATALTVLALLAPAAPAGEQAQRTIALPDEFRPEGIASGPKDSFYVGSIPQGSTTIAPFKRFIHAVNARFDRPDDSDDDIIRLRP